ncbi:MAG: tetratricopeptide repeat protein [Pseudomonadota bacterium]|nr:tetratricopeptide repeat protein [Pseudomonadota bacterium]
MPSPNFMDDSLEQIETAIAALEAQRALLGDAVVSMAVEPLQAKLAAKQAALLRSEQQLKSVTVLFMDVVGSTRLSQQLDPEDVHAVIDNALARLTRIVDSHRGRVLQYAGDSLLAVFGADQTLEDDAERAVRAGLAILAEAPGLAAEVETQYGVAGFDLRVGIHTGTVLLGGGVDAEGSIRGITVNIAARMEQTAPPGALRISQETYRHVRGVFDVALQPPIEMKGIDGPMRSYLVLRAKPRSFRILNRGIEGVETRMVGREAELARLVETFQTTCDESCVALVTVVGEPGIGKSRLGLEFTDWLESLPEPVRFFRARPRPYGNNVPFGVVRDLLAWRLEILDSDPQAVAKTKLAEGIGPLLGTRAAESTALIGQLIGLDFADDPHIAGIAEEARQLRDRAFHALAQYFRLLYGESRAPIVLLLDDLHWADEGSLDFINHLAKACHDVPMLALCLTRSTLYERRPLWGSGQHNHERIDLGPLSKRSSRELVSAMLSRLETVPVALRDLLTSSAEGNPYFVEELIGMLIDDGVIVTGTESWSVSADRLLEVHVPGTLAGVLQARIDSLPASEKAALLNASVIGHVFWDEALRRIAPQADDALAGLTRRELTYGRETSAFEGTREFVFKHHVLHQIAYQGVLKKPRREQHRLAADWLVLRSGDRTSEYFGAIADHYERAGDTANAVTYLRKAGDDAARSFVNVAALDFFTRALALVDTDALRFELLQARRCVYAIVGQRAEQEVDVAALEQLAEALDDDTRRALAAGARASLALVMGDYPGAAKAAARAVGHAESAGNRGAALSAWINWARALQFQGDYGGAEAHMRQSLALAREVGDRRNEATSLTQLGIHASERGDYAAAKAYYRDALEVARANGDRSMESGVINNLGGTEQLLGNYAAAFDLFEQGRRLCAEIGQRVADAYLLCNMAHITFQRGAASESIRWAEQASDLARSMKDRDLQASISSTRGHALAALGRWDEAAACYGEAADIYRQIGRPTMLAEPVCGLARVALARGDVAGAAGLLVEVVCHFDAGGTADGTEDPIWIYLTCHDVLSAAGQPRGRELLRHGHNLLMERAQPLADAERASFLGNVPSHRALVAAFSALPADG